jgi:hypothetical protein
MLERPSDALLCLKKHVPKSFARDIGLHQVPNIQGWTGRRASSRLVSSIRTPSPSRRPRWLPIWPPTPGMARIRSSGASLTSSPSSHVSRHGHPSLALQAPRPALVCRGRRHVDPPVRGHQASNGLCRAVPTRLHTKRTLTAMSGAP